MACKHGIENSVGALQALQKMERGVEEREKLETELSLHRLTSLLDQLKPEIERLNYGRIHLEQAVRLMASDRYRLETELQQSRSEGARSPR